MSFEKTNPNGRRDVPPRNAQSQGVNEVLNSKSARERHQLFTRQGDMPRTDSSKIPQDRVQDGVQGPKRVFGLDRIDNPADDGKVYKNLGYEVPKGREGMEEQTVREYLEERGSSAIPKDREWMLDYKLADFKEFWENKPLEFGEVRSQTSTGGKGADSRGAVKYPGELGEVELGRRDIIESGSWEVPKVIDNTKVVDVSAEGYNCLPRALVIAAGVKDKARIDKLVEAARNHLVKEGWAIHGEYLTLGSQQGAELVRYLRDDLGVPLGKGGVHMHRFSSEGKLIHYDATPGIEGQPQTEVFYMNGHFQALVDTGDPSRKRKKAIRTSEVNSSAKQKLIELLTAPEGEFLANDDRKLSKMRFLELVANRAPTGYEEKFKEAVGQYCEKFKVGAEHLNKIINALEKNSDAACEFLYENRNNIETFFTAQLAEQKPIEQELISPYADRKTQLDRESRNGSPPILGY